MFSVVDQDSGTGKCPSSGVPPSQVPMWRGGAGGWRQWGEGQGVNDTLRFPRAFDPYRAFPLQGDDLQSPLGRAPFT